MAKKVLAIYAREGDSPARASAVNDALVDDLGGRMFVTITYTILDPAARTVTWARAEHNPRLSIIVPPIVDGGPSAGMVVGMKSGPRLPDHEEGRTPPATWSGYRRLTETRTPTRRDGPIACSGARTIP